MLKFPLDLAVENIYLGQTEKDTLLYADVIQGECCINRIVKERNRSSSFGCGKCSGSFRGFSFRIEMNLVLEELNLRVDRLNLSRQEAEIPFIALKGGKIRMNLGGGGVCG